MAPKPVPYRLRPEELLITPQQIDKAHLELSGLDFGAFRTCSWNTPSGQLRNFQVVCHYRCNSQKETYTEEERALWTACLRRNTMLFAAMSRATLALHDKADIAAINQRWQKAMRKAYQEPTKGWLSDVFRRHRDQAPQEYTELRQPLLKEESKVPAHWWRVICNCFGSQ